MPEKVFFMVMTLSMTSQADLASGASCKGNILSMNAIIVIVFLGCTSLEKISINKTFQDDRSKVKVTGLQGDLGT